MKRLTPAFIAIGAALAVAASIAAMPAHAATANVTLADFDFTDSASGNSTTTIAAGDTVTWTWSGDDVHSVTADDGSFDEPAGGTKATGTLSMTFNTPGTYAYYCRVHGGAGGIGMSGTVVVNAAAPTNTPTSTRTPAPTATPVADTPTSTVVATPSGTPDTTSTAAVAPVPTRAPAIAAPAESDVEGTRRAVVLPSTGAGDGASSVQPWLSAALAAFGAMLGAIGVLRRRT